MCIVVKYSEMKKKLNSKGGNMDVSLLVSWGRKNKIFVSDYCDLKDIVEVREMISKLKKDGLWK